VALFHAYSLLNCKIVHVDYLDVLLMGENKFPHKLIVK